MNKIPFWVSKTATFLISQAFSIFGSSVVGYAIIWYFTLETSSAVMVTISTLCSFAPQIVISLFAGVWADRYNRKTIILLSDLFTAAASLVMAVVFLSGYKSYILIFVMSALRSLGMGIQAPAVNAILPQIVPSEKLTKVNGISSSINSALLLVSPAVGGLLLNSFGFAYTLLVDVFTALIASGILLLLKIKRHIRSDEGYTALQELKNGIAFARDNAFIRRLLIFYALFFFLISPLAFMTPLMIERSYGPELWRLSANEIVWTSGSLLGGFLISIIGEIKNKVKLMAFSIVWVSAATILMGVSRNFYLYLALMGLGGVTMPLFNTAQTVLIQQNVSESMLGRVFSLMQLIATATMPLGMLIFGPIGDTIKIEFLLIATGVMLLPLAPFIMTIKTVKV